MAEKRMYEDVPDARGGGQVSRYPVPDPPATTSNQGGSGEGGAVGGGGGDAPPMQGTPAASAGAGAPAPPAIAPPGSEPLARPELPASPYIARSNYESEKIYRLSTPLKGRALIISNEEFSVRNLSKRKYAHDDLNKLVTCLKQLGFQQENMIIWKDLTSKEMKTTLEEESEKREVHDKIEIFMCIIMTHGEENYLYGKDGKKVAIDELTQHFTARKCGGLAMKPKVFVIQACHEPPTVVADSASDSVDFSKKLKTIRIPSEADFLLMHSWVPGSWGGDEGSWFVRELVKMLNVNGKNIDLQKIFAKVVLEVSRMLEQEKQKEFLRKKKQVPYITSTLLRQIIIPKGEYD